MDSTTKPPRRRRRFRRTRWTIGGLIALGFWWREHPSPCPYSLRVWLVIPRPVITWRRLIDVLSPREGERVLEIGAGTGYYAIPVAKRVGPTGRVDALDIQPKMLEHLQRRAREQGVENITTTVIDAHTLPFEDGTFDAVYLCTVLGEIHDRNVALAEMHRVLRPGGRFVDGECLGDPLMLFPEDLRRRSTSVGFEFARRVGVPIAYFSLFRKPEAQEETKPRGKAKAA